MRRKPCFAQGRPSAPAHGLTGPRRSISHGSYNSKAGYLNGSNCPEYFDACLGGPSKVWEGYNDPKAIAITPTMQVTRVSVGCLACGATQWSTAAAQQLTPGRLIVAATITNPVNRTCAPCSSASAAASMSPGLTCDAGVLQQKPGWWRPNGTTAVGFGTALYQCFTDACVGSETMSGQSHTDEEAQYW